MLQFGYHYLSCYLQKIGKIPSISLEEASIDTRLLTLQRQFQLNHGELLLLALVGLQQSHKYVQQLLLELGGLSYRLIKQIYQSKHTDPFSLRMDLLNRFFLIGFQLKPHVLAYLDGVDIPTTLPKIGRIHSNAFILKEVDGHFVYIGSYGMGRKQCFLTLCAWKEISAHLVFQPEEIETKSFYAVVQGGGLCVTSSSFMDQIQDYLKYIQFFVLIAEKDTDYASLFQVFFPPLNYQERWNLWAENPQLFETGVIEYASNFQFSPKEIEEIIHHGSLQQKIKGESHISLTVLSETIQQKLKSKGNSSFEHHPVPFTLDEVILPKKQKTKLYEAIAQVEHRAKVFETYQLAKKIQYGTGLSVLFVGPAGTGKTMTAYAFAHQLHTLLYKIDLSMVVSKYIGETEKNLKKIFTQGKHTQAILFFDEADALFAKRTEVKDSNDKYSNMEAAFLLQEIENYPGTTLLATNYLQNIDESFKRRMKFIIEFPYPSSVERLQIFTESLPPGLPLQPDVDLRFLAEHFELTGANIKNIIYHACFLAASKKDVLDMQCFVSSVGGEFEKMGKQLTPTDFGPYASLWEVPS